MAFLSGRWLLRLILATIGVLLVVAGLWWYSRPVSKDSPEGKDLPTEPVYFTNVAESSGVAFTYQNGEETDRYTILESVGGGVALLDYDGDGLLDLYLPGGGTFEAGDPPRIVGQPGRLYRNLGNWKFADVTAQVMPAASVFYAHAAVVGDYNGDGWPDLLVTGYGRLALYRNESGRRFVEVTQEAGLREDRWTTSAAWADLSGQGRADLYVCRYLDWSFANDPHCVSRADPRQRDVCEPTRFKPLPDSLYRNEGGKLIEVSQQAGLRKDGMGLGVLTADLDEDGRPDVYVANDAGFNFLYLNQGKLQFTESAVARGVAGDDTGRYNGSMGLDVGDYDNSGHPSLWVTNYQGEYHALYRNQGKGSFAYQSNATGIAALGQQYVGFGTALFDLDNDGWLDLVIVNGHVLRYPLSSSFRQLPVLLHNQPRRGRRFFANISRQGGAYFQRPALGRGLAVGDLDNDGWPDLVISHCNTPVALLRNQAPRTANWLGIQLRGKNNRPVLGASVTVEAGGRKLTRFLVGGGSYLSSRDPRLLFGLAEATQVRQVSVRWPWGQTETFAAPEPGKYWELVEGTGQPRPAGAIRP